MAEDTFVNKVETSGIQTLDLKDYAPKEKSLFFDIKDHLFQGLIVKEKEFKASLSQVNWEEFKGKAVAIDCTEDTIIPPWVYMLISSYLQDLVTHMSFSTAEVLDLEIWKENVEKADLSHFEGKKVVVRAHANLDPSLYVLISQRLKPIVKTLMYGEAGLPKVIWKN